MRFLLFTPSLRSRLAAAWCACLPLCSYAAAPADTLQEIRAPHYGDVLFLYFQDRYFSSLTTLMVAQQQGHLGLHSEESELLRAGIELSYGMHRAAGETFLRLAERGLTAATRDRAWYYLAKIRYQRGAYRQAQEALTRVGNELPPALAFDRGLLQAQLRMVHDDYAAAITTLSSLDRKSQDGIYADYNLGIARIKSGDNAGGRSALDAVGRMPGNTEETRALRDRANLALGFAALTNEDPQAAQSYLQRVRLYGPEATRALLGAGWAAAALKQPQEALASWQELTRRDAHDPAVIEAHIAIAYAYAELGRWAQSAQAYQDAITTFDQQRLVLDESIASIRSGQLVEGMLQTPDGGEMGWFWKSGNLPVSTQTSILAVVAARHDFQEALKNYRDLRYLARNLQDWRDKLEAFDDMLSTRGRAFAQTLPASRAQRGGMAFTPLRERHEELKALTGAAQQAADGMALADNRERDLLARIKRVQHALANAPADTGPSESRERVQLASGLMTWNLAQSFNERLWSAQRSLDALALELQVAASRDAALERAQTQEPQRLNSFAIRVGNTSPAVSNMLARVEGLSQAQREAIEAIAVRALVDQKARMADYATQARFALAQIYDRGTEAAHPSADTTWESQRATPP